MKMPEKIKKGLSTCTQSGDCPNCPYETDCKEHAESGDNLWLGEPAMADALAYIQQLEAAQPKWISVEDELPQHGRYLVITMRGDSAKVHTATYNEMGWWMHANFGEVTHWMLLPELPKEE